MKIICVVVTQKLLELEVDFLYFYFIFLIFPNVRTCHLMLNHHDGDEEEKER